MSEVDEFLPEIRQAVIDFMNRVPFNKLVGFTLTEITPDKVCLTLPMRPDLVGNFITGILHGGVISSMIDVAGGAMSLVGAFRNLEHLPLEERVLRLSKIGTIDLRIDYLRPGRGERFDVTATLLRAGNKVAVTRAEFFNDQGELCAVGTGTYLCG
ncbi:thioesterase family protein [Aestuariirhabdus litorea]|uniref:Medium/long-chain acyl-CoA thioesterase YigI n=1 Tax=Aestuariirhabdus litorea TaxID=2528527 RepID=A0A3P3VKS4_9GAMM|nr:thioesterase family protein [Aestuariirhabdus litorea]RRJ82478.1 thioesterase family protein [Aestuariirhabdus litorea]RWW92639.1 thioesterase family protein [Endozoicomonadaceae bacterium GTF-13]